MNWKNWPYWVKGGVVGIVIFSALFLVDQFAVSRLYLFNVINAVGLLPLFKIIAFLPGKGATLITPLFCEPVSAGLSAAPSVCALRLIYFLVFSIDLLQYFIVGIFFGWLFGKIKNYRQSKVNGNIS